MSSTKVNNLRGHLKKLRQFSLLLLCLAAGGCHGEITRPDDPNWTSPFSVLRVVAGSPE